jgi:hypothetical protein
MSTPRSRNDLLKVIEAYEKNSLPVPQYVYDELAALDKAQSDFYVHDDYGFHPAKKDLQGSDEVRALAMFSAKTVDEVEVELSDLLAEMNVGRRQTKSWKQVMQWSSQYRYYFPDEVTKEWCARQGWTWTAMMDAPHNATGKKGSGVKAHLAPGEVPDNCLARITGGYAVIRDGKVHAAYNHTRGGKRAVYGYWQQ